MNIINKDFSDFIIDNSGGKKTSIYLMTIANGVCMALMMYSLSVGLEDYGANNAVSLRAFLMFVLSLGAYYITQAYGARIASTAILKGLGDLELRVMDKLRRVDYAAFSDMSPELIYAAVGGDKYGAVMAARFYIPTMSSMVVVALTGLYMCTISVPGVILVGLTLYSVIRIRGGLDRKIAKRKAQDGVATDRFTMSLRDVVEGFNELKMNRKKSDALLKKKIEPASEIKNARLLGTELLQMRSIVLEQATLFLPLGLTLFILPTLFQTATADLVKIISVTLIVIWPAYTLVQMGPVSAAAAGIVERLSGLEKTLNDANLEPAIESEVDYPKAPDFNEITCKNIAYAYEKRPGDEKSFVLRIDGFHIKKGELIVMCGGNGSGKSTFMRVLAGLEQPSEGVISVDDTDKREIGEAEYRAMFSLIMADFHLFDQFYGTEPDSEQLRKWVNKLGLQGKVTPEKDLPTVELSSGQKKRMALLAAIMENRQIMLLDEVAADFDPYFRELYYGEILPELKAEGRTLFVISHDDRYYKIADRILTMREGSISEE